MKITTWAPLIKTKQRRREFNGIIPHSVWGDGVLIRFQVEGSRRFGHAWIGKNLVVVRWDGRHRKHAVTGPIVGINDVEDALKGKNA